MSPFAPGESPFNLPPDRSAKAASSLIESDEEHLAAVRAALTATIHEVESQLAATRRQGGGSGQSALDRDLEVRRLSARLQFVLVSRGGRRRTRVDPASSFLARGRDLEGLGWKGATRTAARLKQCRG